VVVKEVNEFVKDIKDEEVFGLDLMINVEING